MMENNLHVQYDLANLPHCMQCILQIDHRYSWKQSKILDLFSDCIFLPPIEINTCTMQQTPAKDSASNVSQPVVFLTKAVLIFAYIAVCCTHTYIYISFVK